MSRKIPRKLQARQIDIRAVPATSLHTRPIGSNKLEVLSIINGRVTRLGLIYCGGSTESLINKLKGEGCH